MNYIISLVLLVSITSSCSKEANPSPQLKNGAKLYTGGMTNSPATVMGAFVSFAHNLAGTAVLHIDSAGKKDLRFQNYTMDKGPDVHVYFSKSNNYSKANVIEIATLRDAFVNAPINFDSLPSSYNSKYEFVLVYCVKYNSLFGYAELK